MKKNVKKQKLFMKRMLLIILILLPFYIYSALLVDDCETGNMSNSIAGYWITYTDGVSSLTFTANSSPGYNSNYCKKAAITILKPTDSYAGALAFLKSDTTSMDLSSYYGVRFYAKGYGSFEIALPIEATRSEYNHYLSEINLNNEWQLYELPFSLFTQTWGTPKIWDPSTIYGFQINTSWNYNQAREIYIDNIEFYTQQEATNTITCHFISFKPKINQIGYLPDAKKFFTVITQTAGTNHVFYVKYTSNNNVAYTGYTSSNIIHDSAADEDVVTGDFSQLTRSGEYYIEINGQTSYNFKISSDIYDNLFKDVLRTYYIIRCGTALQDNKTGLNHSACHLQDASYDDKAGSRDFTGGWHNAGDFGKSTHEHAFSCSFMMWLYELRKVNMKGLNINIPESNNKISDLLDEARWGLTFLLKMQNSDGSVYHKIDTEPNFPWGLAPENDPYQRTAKPQNKGSVQFSTIDAATFCAVMCQAYRVFKDFDNAFALKCSKAAVDAWNWIDANPKTGQQDPYYTDTEYWEELMWAYAEMFRLTGNNYFLNLFENELNIRQLTFPNWMKNHFLGYFSLYFEPKIGSGIKTIIKNKILNLADSYKNVCNNNGYRVAHTQDEYYWGSNGNASSKAVVLLAAYLLSCDESYKDYALYQLDYLLGVNGLEQVFITGYGSKKNLNPYHWTKMVYNNSLPGWCSGGPNKYPAGADTPLLNLQNLGTPAQKCWLDLCAANGSYASNEGETSLQALLLFLTGFFFSEITTNEPQSKVMDNFSKVKFYPSPYNELSGDEGITFINLPDYIKFQVFNLNGELIYEKQTNLQDGRFFWKIKTNRKNSSPSAGIYVFVITDKNGNKKMGKIGIVK